MDPTGLPHHAMEKWRWQYNGAGDFSGGCAPRKFRLAPEYRRGECRWSVFAFLSGEGLILHTDDGAQAPQANVSLTRSVAPYRFAGELPINAELIADPVLDLNMMTRRDVCQHHMQRLSAGDHFVSAGDSQQVLLYCAQGSATLSSGESLVQGDLCLFEERHEHEGVIVGLSAADDAQLYLITIHFLNMGQS